MPTRTLPVRPYLDRADFLNGPFNLVQDQVRPVQHARAINRRRYPGPAPDQQRHAKPLLEVLMLRLMPDWLMWQASAALTKLPYLTAASRCLSCWISNAALPSATGPPGSRVRHRIGATTSSMSGLAARAGS
jgi:hypothetical protein